MGERGKSGLRIWKEEDDAAGASAVCGCGWEGGLTGRLGVEKWLRRGRSRFRLVPALMGLGDEAEGAAAADVFMVGGRGAFVVPPRVLKAWVRGV